jgi:hypothetical protein
VHRRRSLRSFLHTDWKICYWHALTVDTKSKFFSAQWLRICSFFKRGSAIGNSWMILSGSLIWLQICHDVKQPIVPNIDTLSCTQHPQQRNPDSYVDITNEHLLSQKLRQNITEFMTYSLALVSFRQSFFSLRWENESTRSSQTDQEFDSFYGRVFQPDCKLFIFKRWSKPIPEDLDHQGMGRSLI